MLHTQALLYSDEREVDVKSSSEHFIQVIESDSKMDRLLHKLSEVLEFFRESSFPKVHFADVDDALRFDLSEYFAASRRGLEAVCSYFTFFLLYRC